MGSKTYDFTMAIGDSETDEDLFKLLDSGAFSIRVEESAASSARYHLPDQKAVIPFLENLLSVNKYIIESHLNFS